MPSKNQISTWHRKLQGRASQALQPLMIARQLALVSLSSLGLTTSFEVGRAPCGQQRWLARGWTTLTGGLDGMRTLLGDSGSWNRNAVRQGTGRGSELHQASADITSSHACNAHKIQWGVFALADLTPGSPAPRPVALDTAVQKAILQPHLLSLHHKATSIQEVVKRECLQSALQYLNLRSMMGPTRNGANSYIACPDPCAHKKRPISSDMKTPCGDGGGPLIGAVALSCRMHTASFLPHRPPLAHHHQH